MSTDSALRAKRLFLPMNRKECQILRPKSISKSDQESRRNRSKGWQTVARRILSSARGGLEPHFRVLFLAIFHGVSQGNFHQGRNRWKVAEAKDWSFLVSPRTFFMCVLIIS